MTDPDGTSRPVSWPPPLQRHSPGSSTSVLVTLPAQADGQMVLTLVGDIDMSTARTVCAAARRCLNDRPRCLSLDLRSVEFCDVAGVRALRWAQRAAATASAEFRIIAPGPLLVRMLTLMNADDLLSAVQIAPPQVHIAHPAPSG